MLDEVSGSSRRRGSSRRVSSERFAGVQRSLDHRLSVVTGLPRADRWVEVRAGAVEHLVDVGRGHGHVVVDTGFCLEEDPAVDSAAGPAATR